MELSLIPELHLDLGPKLGEGAFGLVRMGTLRDRQLEVAVKLESAAIKRPLLLREATTMQALQKYEGIPKLYGFGTFEGFHYLAMQLLDKSLYDRFRECGNRLSVSTTLKCTEQILTIFHYVHSERIAHRDVKPENFLFDHETGAQRVFLIDFGLARKVSQGFSFKPYHGVSGHVVGTMPFVSINIHLGVAPSFRDDLEALAYMFIYLLQGGLPWYGPSVEKLTEKQVREMKQTASSYDLCRGLPIEFEMLLKYARHLSIDELPDYSALLKSFQSAASTLNFDLRAAIVWEKEVRQRRRSIREKAKSHAESKSRVSEASSSYLSQSKGRKDRRASQRSRKPSRQKTPVKPFLGFNGKKASIFERLPTFEKVSTLVKRTEGLKTDITDGKCITF